MSSNKVEGLIWFMVFLFITMCLSFDKLLEVLK